MFRTLALACALSLAVTAVFATPIRPHHNRFMGRDWRVGQQVPHWWQDQHVEWRNYPFLSEPFAHAYWIERDGQYLLVQGQTGTVSKVVRKP